jgi:hypothetical protein
VVVHVPGELTALTVEIIDRKGSALDTGHLPRIGAHQASEQFLPRYVNPAALVVRTSGLDYLTEELDVAAHGRVTDTKQGLTEISIRIYKSTIGHASKP